MSYKTSLSTHKYASDNMQDDFFELIGRNLENTYGPTALKKAGINFQKAGINIHHCSTEPEEVPSYKPSRFF